MRKKILITGSNGLLGQKIVYSLLKSKKADFVATSLGENRLLRKNGYLYESMDITNSKAIEQVVSKHRPTTIINTAAMTNVDACETEKEKCLKLNVEAVGNLSNICSSHNIHLIHLSTDFIFNGKAGPYKEVDEPDPLSYYGWSKLESEKKMNVSNCPWTIIRTIIVYGIVDNMSRSNVVLWAKNSLETGKEINVVDDQVRAPTLAEDLAEACISAALKKATGIYHVSGKDIMSIYELVQRVADYYNLDKSLIKPIKSESLGQPAKRPPITGFVLDKAYRELDYQPHSFLEGIELMDSQMQRK